MILDIRIPQRYGRAPVRIIYFTGHLGAASALISTLTEYFLAVYNGQAFNLLAKQSRRTSAASRNGPG